jgi:hypothetical protein
MAKANFNDVLLKKGEKIALAVGLGLCGLFLVLGVVNMVSATSPTVKVKEFDREAKRVESAVRADGQPAADLPEWVQKPLKPSQIDTDFFTGPGAPFEPVSKPNMLRENPPVLGIVDVQMNLMTVPMKALDLDIGPDGSVRIGVLVTKRKGERDRKDVTKGVREAFKTEWQKAQDEKKKSRTGKHRRRPNMMGGMPPGMPGAMPPGMGSAGMPGAMPGQAAMAPPGSMPGGGGDADTGGPGMMGGYNPYGSMMGSGMMGGPRDDKTVKYVTPDEAARDNLELAQTVYPLRAILVNMAFPLKKQLEEIRIALRARNLQEAMMLSGYRGQYGPVFDGFEVERQIIYPDGKRTEWAVYDHEAEYWSKIYARAVAYQPDDGYLVPLIRYNQALAAPLPQLADQLGSYPELQIPAIVEVVKKMKEAGKQPVVASDWEKRFQKKPGGDRPYAIGGGNAFMQPNGMNMGEAQPGMPPGMPGATGSSSFGPPRPGGLPGSPASGFPGATGSPQMPPGNYPPGAGAAGYPPGMTGSVPGAAGMPVPGMPGAGGFMQNTQLGPESEYLLMRFMDVDVQPGYGYRYRIRVKMRNPNFGQKDKVSRADEANKEFLYGQWAEIQAPFVVPPESYLYAYDPDKYIEQAKALSEDAGRDTAAINKVMQLTPVQKGQEAVVQFQTWMPGVRIEGTKKEPVGTWVVAAMPVARGEYIGHRQLIQLPLWSAGAQNYVLRELSGSARVANVRDPKHQPKGWPVNFRIPSVLVDYTGGRVNKQVADRNIEDDAAEELLIIRADGKLLVRNSVADMRDPVREKRNKDWDDWLKRVKDRKEVETSGPPGGAPNDFGRVPMP